MRNGSSFDSAGDGHRLSSSSSSNDHGSGSGSGSSGIGNQALNAAELRARRLAALEKKTKPSKDVDVDVDTSTTNIRTTNTRTNIKSSVLIPSSPTVNPSNNSNNSSNSSNNSSNNNITMNTSKNSKTAKIQIEDIPLSTQTQFQSNFNALMWDDHDHDHSASITTEADKQRWFEQGIHSEILINNETPDHTSATPNSTGTTRTPTCINSHSTWGLIQSHGGPCGVLAAVQAEMVTTLDVYATLTNRNNRNNSSNAYSYFTKSDIEKGLAQCIARILVRASIAQTITSSSSSSSSTTPSAPNAPQIHDKNDCKHSVKLILPCNHSNKQAILFDHSTLRYVEIQLIYEDSSSSSNGSLSMNMNIYSSNTTTPEAKRIKQQLSKVEEEEILTYYNNQQQDEQNKNCREMMTNRLIDTTTKYLLSKQKDCDERIRLEHFYGQGGVMLLTMSLVASRGVDRIKSDMDAGTTHHLTAQFGHSSQELINLLLTGQATTNIFDNTMTLGGSLECHGIQSQPSIGYLSQLEALRYCSVGDYYKLPKNPVWVIGSTSHFSVLFGSKECLKESQSDLLLEQCRRAFKSVEGAEENGFIPVIELNTILKELDINLNDNQLGTLAASLEMGGAGIILWNEFWKKVSRLKTGASLESVLQHNDDEEYARQLQAQFESENNDGNSGRNNVSGAISCSGATTPSTTNGLNFETYNDHSFKLYHYNGMRGGELTSVTVTRMNPEEAVGADATLVDSSAGLINNGADDDLESVIRTKYPSCMFDWGGRQPPSLH